MKFTIECEQEEDGRWLAEVIELPGALAYGRTPEEAMSKVQVLGLRVLADRIEHGEEAPALMSISFATVWVNGDPQKRGVCLQHFCVLAGVSSASLAHIALSHALAGLMSYLRSTTDNEEIGPRMLARIAKVTGLKPEDL